MAEKAGLCREVYGREGSFMQGEGTTGGMPTKKYIIKANFLLGSDFSMGFPEEAFVDAATEEEELKAIFGAEIIILQLIKLDREKIHDNEIQVKPNYHC